MRKREKKRYEKNKVRYVSRKVCVCVGIKTRLGHDHNARNASVERVTVGRIQQKVSYATGSMNNKDTRFSQSLPERPSGACPLKNFSTAFNVAIVRPH